MKNKLSILMIIGMLLFCVFFTQNSYAKYVLHDSLSMKVYIDKTPPIIELVNGTNKESFPETKSEVIKRTENTIINTTDNIKIDHNEIRYNPTEKRFDNVTPANFDSGKELTDEGYYEITSIDTSGNTTKIIILLDKSAPNVTVRFYKKGEVSLLKSNIKLENGGVC